MSISMEQERTDPLWPSFWHDVPEGDRAPVRDILAELLGHGVLLGDSGSGRELFQVGVEHRFKLEDYLAPLGLELLVDDETPLLQARPRTESCQLLGSFNKNETLVLLSLWRVWDEGQTSGLNASVTLTLDDLYEKLRLHFESIERPERTQLEDVLSKLKRFRLIRTRRPDADEGVGATLIEVLPSLAKVIPFDSIEQWQERVEMAAPSAAGESSSSQEGREASV